MRPFKFQKEHQSKNQSQNNFNSKDLFKDIEIYCSQGNHGRLYCFECEEDAVICDDENCQCHQAHFQCEYYQNIRILHQKLNLKVFNDFNPKKVMEKIQNIVDEILKIQNQIQKQFTYFGLNKSEIEISKIIKNTNQRGRIKGSDLKKFKESRQSTEVPHFQDSLIKYKRLLQVSKINVLKLFNELQQQIVEEHINFYQKKIISEILDSEIVKTPQQLKVLNGLINPSLRFQSTEKIFSYYGKDKLSIGKLKGACQKKQSLLFLIQNDLGKKFGVYSESEVGKNSYFYIKNDLKPSCLFSINCDISQTSDMKKIQSRSSYMSQGSLYAQCLIFEIFDQPTNRSLSYLKIGSQNCYYNVTNYASYYINGVEKNSNDQSKSYRGIKSVEVFQVHLDKIKKTLSLNNSKPPQTAQTVQKAQGSKKIETKSESIFMIARQDPKEKKGDIFPKNDEGQKSSVFSKKNEKKKLNLFQSCKHQLNKELNQQKQSQNNDDSKSNQLSENNDGRALAGLFKGDSNESNEKEKSNLQKRLKSQLMSLQKPEKSQQQHDDTRSVKQAVNHTNTGKPQLFARGGLFENAHKQNSCQSNNTKIFSSEMNGTQGLSFGKGFSGNLMEKTIYRSSLIFQTGRKRYCEYQKPS